MAENSVRLHSMAMNQTVTLIGFGEAGSTFAASAQWGTSARAFDIDPARSDAMARTSVVTSGNAREMLSGAGLVLSLVTADAALEAARSYAPMLERGALWIDMNSVAPETKRASARFIELHGARYVDAAILAPVHPARMNVPLLLAGPSANDARSALRSLGFPNVSIAGSEIGRASAIKLIRSVMIKGIEALTDEMIAAAQAAGVVDEVLASLDASEKADGWQTRAAYNLERMCTHGGRRAAEMEEAARTLRSLGVEPVMTDGTVRRQREAATRLPAKRSAA